MFGCILFFCFKVIGNPWLGKRMPCFVSFLIAFPQKPKKTLLGKRDPNCMILHLSKKQNFRGPPQLSTVKSWGSPKHTWENSSIHICSPKCFLICKKLKIKYYVSVTEQKYTCFQADQCLSPLDCRVWHNQSCSTDLHLRASCIHQVVWTSLFCLYRLNHFTSCLISWQQLLQPQPSGTPERDQISPTGYIFNSVQFKGALLAWKFEQQYCQSICPNPQT